MSYDGEIFNSNIHDSAVRNKAIKELCTKKYQLENFPKNIFTDGYKTIKCN